MSRYKIVEENGKKYIVDENGNVISNSWKEIWGYGLVKGQSDYYKVKRDDDKKAIFHKDNPDKQISDWWKEIWANGLVKGQSEYYKVQRNDDKEAILHKDYKDVPLTEWLDNVNVNDFIEKHKDMALSKIILDGIKRYMRNLY